MEKQIHDFVVKCEKRRIFATERATWYILYIYMSSSDVSKMWKFNEPSDERSLYQLLVRAYSSFTYGIHIPTGGEEVRPRTFII